MITPSGPIGSVVSGAFCIDDFSPSDANVTQNSQPGISPTASNVAAFAYHYRVGAPPPKP